MNRLQILLVENSKEDAEVILNELRRGGVVVEFERVDTRSTMQKALMAKDWDVILCAYSLRQFNAMEALAVLNQSGLDIPLIVFSGTINEEQAAAALEAGASDCLMNDKLARLVPAIQHALKDAETRRERQQAEATIQQMVDRFRALTENAPDGIALIDQEGHMQFVSPSGRKMFGYVQEQDLELTPAEFTHPDDLPAFLSALSNLVADPAQVPTHQYRVRHRDGSWRWIESTFTNLLSVKGIEAIVINFRDITERKQGEEKIKQQLERLAALREVDQLITSTFDLQMGLNVLLSHTLRLLGVDAAAILLLDPVQNILEYKLGVGFRTNAIQNANVKLGMSFAGRVALERRLVQILDAIHATHDPLLSEFLKREDFVGYFGAPLIVKGKVLGVLEAYTRTMIERDQDWLDFLSALAGQAALMIEDFRMFNDLQVSHTELTLAYDATIEGWSRALDLRDRETEGHTKRVTDLAVKLARQMGFPEDELIHIRRGALLHDIGKLGVPDQILWKTTELTGPEWELMKKHPVLAYELLSPIHYLKSAAIDIPYCHHEKVDGSGYPRGLRGDEIPLAARVFAVVDVWDALTSDRPYRRAWTNEKAVEYIRAQAGRNFDPKVVEVFLKLIESA